MFLRRIAATAAAAALTIAALAASTITSTAATAATTTSGPTSIATAGPHSYAFSVTTDASTTSTGTLNWDNTTWALSMTASTGTLAKNYCVTVYFDWRSSGHHDARALRDCSSNDTYSYSFPDANTGNLVGGPSRMGVCYGKDNTAGTCSYFTLGGNPYVQLDWSVWPQPTWAYPCVMSWAKKANDGTLSSFIDAHPRRRLLQGTTC